MRIKNRLRSLQTWALALTLTGLTGCEWHLSHYANAIEKALGVPVVVEAGSTDHCAKKQLKSLITEYRAESKPRQKELREEFQTRYGRIVIQKPVYAARETIRGHQVKLIDPSWCDDSRFEEECRRFGGAVIESRELGETREIAEVELEPKIDKSSELSILLRGWSAWYGTRIYLLQDRGTFEPLSTPADVLEAELAHPERFRILVTGTSITGCGELARLSELL